MVGGNHDRWGGSFWQEELDIEFAPHRASFTLGGHPGLAVHGDGMVELDRPARLLHRITSHPATIGLFGAMHPDLGLWLVDRLSGGLGARERSPAAIAAAAGRQRRWAEAELARQPELGLIAMGHTHVPAAVEANGGRYVNPGAWFDGYRYAVVDSGQTRLRQFQP